MFKTKKKTKKWKKKKLKKQKIFGQEDFNERFDGVVSHTKKVYVAHERQETTVNA